MCVAFDGRQDDTNVLIEVDGTSHTYPGTVKEEHISVCSEPGSRYLFYFTPAAATKKEPHALQVAREIYRWLEERGLYGTLMAIAGDSTNVNTGVKGGVMRRLELLLNRKLVWLVCDLHTNELPLRHLVESLDGKTLSATAWSGELGKLLPTVLELEIDPGFKPVTVGPPSADMPPDIAQDLSNDQHYGYHMLRAVRAGVVPARLARLQIGPVCHSRWLTTANRLLRLWVSQHHLTGEALTHLTWIVEFIVGVYYPCWFVIRSHPCWSEAPRHLLH